MFIDYHMYGQISLPTFMLQCVSVFRSFSMDLSARLHFYVQCICVPPPSLTFSPTHAHTQTLSRCQRIRAGTHVSACVEIQLNIFGCLWLF